MTCEKLIKRIKEDFGDEKAFFIERIYHKLCDTVKQLNDALCASGRKYEMLYDNRREFYHTIYGFLWALFDTDYITNEQHIDLMDELVSITYQSHNISEPIKGGEKSD